MPFNWTLFKVSAKSASEYARKGVARWVRVVGIGGRKTQAARAFDRRDAFENRRAAIRAAARHGWDVGAAGGEVTECPYPRVRGRACSTQVFRRAWLRGFRAARSGERRG